MLAPLHIYHKLHCVGRATKPCSTPQPNTLCKDFDHRTFRSTHTLKKKNKKTKRKLKEWRKKMNGKTRKKKYLKHCLLESEKNLGTELSHRADCFRERVRRWLH